MKARALLLIGLAGLAVGARGDLAVSFPFGDHMVLQRDAPVPLWGTAAPGEKLTVDFAGQTHPATADGDGRWQVTLAPMPARAIPGDLRVQSQSSAQKTNIADVVIGDIWLCAGQSNMEWPLGKEMYAAAELPRATNASLRLLNLPFAGQYVFSKPFGPAELARMTPDQFYRGAWQPCSPAAARNFSAVGYYFGRAVQRATNVPLGLIHLAVGGSPIEAWIRRSALAADPALAPLVRGHWLTNEFLKDWCQERGHQNLDRALRAGEAVPGDELGPNHPFKPGFLWEAGLARLRPLALRGLLWYQGESNSLLPERVRQHERLFPLLVRDWRAQWGHGDLPFYYVQLSGISTNAGYPAQGWPEFRDQQRRFLAQLTNVGLAVCSDLGHPTDVHPRNKREVGHRLAQCALGSSYGQPVETSGPLPISARYDGTQLRVAFSHGAGLATSNGQPPATVEVEVNGSFVPAAARLDGPALIIAAGGGRPTAVRYAWTPFCPAANLVNAAGLPASTFHLTVGD